MNYWHLQMHPSNSGKFRKETLVAILEEKGVIGMGESWENKNGELVSDPTYFKRDMQVDDVVLIRDGGSPTALVQVSGDWYIENNINEDFDWFGLRRPVKLLKIYGNEDKGLLRKILNQFGTSQIQSSGTLTPCNGSNGTNHFIKKWHLKVRKELIMSSIKLNDQRKNDINVLWEDFKNSQTANEVDTIDKSIVKLKDDWLFYKKKLNGKSLMLDDYTNRLGNSEAQGPGGYLCNFLERETRDIYGSSKPGNANNFEIKLNEDGETYTFRDQLKPSDKGKNKFTKEQAENKFNDNISPILYSIVNNSDPIDKITAVEKSKYAAKQVLRKLAVLDNHSDFLYIYSDGVIDSLHNEFLESETETNLGKNHEIRIAINNVLQLDDTPVNAVLVSRFLWKYATSKGVADENTPNVILYGPPGTGKTYSVKQSLNFLCLGDSTRYEFITFHPSFTYEDFIDGIKPKGVTNDGNIKFELVDGVFKKFCKKAKDELIKAKKEKREPKPYYFVVDEINRANLSSVFGETLMCLEKDYRYDVDQPNDNLYKTQYSALMESLIQDSTDSDISSIAFEYQNESAYFGVPKNLFFIGMMNDVDKSIDAFDLALRRRFKWIRKDFDPDVLVQETKFNEHSDFKNMQEYANACIALNHFITTTLGLGKSYEFGHSFFMKIKDISKNSKTISKKNMEVLFNLYLRPSLKEYLRSVFPEQELDNKLKEALNLFVKNLK